ncbi:MAG: hypothetical protein ABIA75_02460 [Candidatus Neomarinimicrobiota bacterium]
MSLIRNSVLSLLLLALLPGQNLRPYILIAETEWAVPEIAAALKAGLQRNNFQVLGEYQPARDVDRWVVVITAPELLAAVGEVGGLTGFAMALRIGITREADLTQITCVNPLYQGNAYFQGDYPLVEEYYTAFYQRLKTALQDLGIRKWSEFGSEDGLTADRLRKYHYMLGMEYFNDVVKLNTLDDFASAVQTVESNESLSENVEIIYSIALAGQELKLYGIALSGDLGEDAFLPVIDTGTPRHTAFLPYEILISGADVFMLHGRYRIALAFPDLTMMTFGKIMTTPGDIEDLLRQLAR